MAARTSEDLGRRAQKAQPVTGTLARIARSPEALDELRVALHHRQRCRIFCFWVGSFHELYDSLPDLPKPVRRAGQLHLEETDHANAGQIVWDYIMRSGGHSLWWRR